MCIVLVWTFKCLKIHKTPVKLIKCKREKHLLKASKDLKRTRWLVFVGGKCSTLISFLCDLCFRTKKGCLSNNWSQQCETLFIMHRSPTPASHFNILFYKFLCFSWIKEEPFKAEKRIHISCCKDSLCFLFSSVFIMHVSHLQQRSMAENKKIILNMKIKI